jgi:hypothetical protein
VVLDQPGEATDGGVHALARHHPPQLQDDALVGRPVEGEAGQRLADRRQFGRVEAARDDGDPRRVGVVQADQVLLVLRALGEDAVGLGDDAVLDLEARVREAVGVLLM